MLKLNRLTPLTLALTLLLALISHTHAQTLADRVPADALVYVSWRGSDAMKPQYDQSHLKTVVDASTLPDFLEKQLPQLLLKDAPADAAASLNAALEAARSVWKLPGALFIAPPTPANDSLPEIVILVDAGKNAPQLEKQLKDLFTELTKHRTEDDEERPLPQVRTVGNTVQIFAGAINETTQAALAKNAPHANPLSASPAFKQVLSKVDANGALVAYIDVPAFTKLALTAAINEDESVPAEKIFAALGVNSIKHAAYSVNYNGKFWEDRLFTKLEGPRKGVLTLFSGKPLTTDAFKVVPKSAPAASALTLNFAEAFKQLRAGIAEVSPEEAAKFDENIKEADTFLKLSIEKDILAPLGEEWVIFRTVRDGDANLPLGTTVLNKLNDSKTFAATLKSLINLAAESGIPLPIETQEVAGVETYVLNLGTVSYTAAVAEGYLAVAPTDEFENLLKQIKNKKDSIVDAEGFAPVLKRLANAHNKAMVIDYGDPKPTYLILSKALDQLIQLAAMEGVEIPSTVIPDFEKMHTALLPGGGALWLDADGIHLHASNAFPGAGAINGQVTSSAPIAAGAVAILLPSLGRARELANRSHEAANLRGIAQSCIIWANDNNDNFPEHVAQLVAAKQISPQMLVSKRSNTKPAVLTPEQMEAAAKDWTAIKDIIEKHSDVVYLGKGLKVDTDSSQVVIYFDPAKVPASQGMNIAFADAHAEWCRPGSWEDIFKQANEARKKNKYPLIETPKLPAKKKPATQPAKP